MANREGGTVHPISFAWETTMTAMRWLRLPGIAMILMLGTMGVSLQLGGVVSAASPTLRVDATLPAEASQAEVYVLAQPPLSDLKPGATISMTTLARTSASGTALSVSVPVTTALEALAAGNDGIVNLVMYAVTSRGYTTDFFPMNLGSETLSKSIDLGQLPALLGMSYPMGATVTGGATTPGVIPNCVYTTAQTSNDVASKAVEIHVASDSTATGEFQIANYADSTISVGVSSGNDGPYSASGTVGVYNGVGVGGGHTWGNNTIAYAYSHYDYVREVNTLTEYCIGPQSYVEATYNYGDVFTGSGSPSGNPYGSCHADPYGFATVSGPGYYTKQGGTGNMIGGTANVFGFSFSGSTGYNSNVNTTWRVSSGQTSYVCGNNGVPQYASVDYNDSY